MLLFSVNRVQLPTPEVCSAQTPGCIILYLCLFF
uniref:Uncharacterized protein n=1 Tax=Anguilla anguilla TaxID=7936 RepID=A0A0E9VK23_ANGAN